ncbi:unnamed protein product [Cuscuta epithymum]|uniref:Protein kinase domain-containing protein n=1 Tax=Cuscuta epithymum TaxID=186058 RepID=A0AAV0E4C2_9ASTE|nr:unnamed protein product [Cuscuta epithymum]
MDRNDQSKMDDDDEHSPVHARSDLPLPGGGVVGVETRIRMKQGTEEIKLFESRTSQPGITRVKAYVAKGTIGRKPGLTVYKATVVETTIKELTLGRSHGTMVWNEPLAVKVADNPHSISMLRNEVRRSCGVKSRHPNLLGIRDDSLVRAASHEAGKNSKYFAAVLMPDCGSVRNIMRKRGGGFQGREDLILCVLRSILNALDFLHQQHIPHGDITAGHVYLTSPRRFHTCSPLKLGFAATLYHEDETAPGTTCSASLPMSSISQWAAAPEVAVASHNSNTGDYKHLYSEEKADIFPISSFLTNFNTIYIYISYICKMWKDVRLVLRPLQQAPKRNGAPFVFPPKSPANNPFVFIRSLTERFDVAC